MVISNRLKSIYNFIDKKDKVIDVGCDHALLSIYLYLNKKNKYIVASDINEKPLEKALENIKKYNLEDKIKIVCQDGIKDVFKCDTAIISGMGTTTILNILSDKNLSNLNKIIISSNNDYYMLRKKMNKKGFYIDKEDLVYEKGKYYPVIVYRRGKQHLKNIELEYGPILLKEKSEVFLKYIDHEKNKKLKIYKSLPNKYIIKKLIIKKEIKSLNKI